MSCRHSGEDLGKSVLVLCQNGSHFIQWEGEVCVLHAEQQAYVLHQISLYISIVNAIFFMLGRNKLNAKHTTKHVLEIELLCLSGERTQRLWARPDLYHLLH